VRPKADEIASLIYRMAQKRKKQNPSIINCSAETVHAIVRVGSPGGISENTGVGFVKDVGVKPGVKQGIMDIQSGES